MIEYYSDACQDYYASKVLKNQNGFFLDIGAGTDDGGRYGSNTFYFEKLGWNGICIDLEKDRIFNRNCTTKAVKLSESNLSSILEETKCPMHVDYLSIDIDGLDYEVLDQFLNSGRTFSYLTIEHDIGTMNPGRDKVKEKIYNRLISEGYLRIADNVCNRSTFGNLKIGYPFEDWYINPKFINSKDFYNENR